MEHTLDFYPTSLALVKGKYYVVATVPGPLREKLGKQIRRSTGTSDRKLAQAAQHNITEAIYKVFREELRVSRFGLTQKFMKEEGITGTLEESDLEAIEHILSVAKLKRATNTSVGFDSDSAAIEELETFLSPQGYSPDKSLEAISSLYLESRSFSRDKTKVAVELALNEFIACVGNLSIDTLTKQHAYKFASELERQGKANQTIKTKVSAIRSFLGWCEREGIIKATPFVELNLKHYGKKKTSYRPIPKDTLRAILRDSEYPQEVLLTHCLLFTGCRLDEFATASYEQIKERDGIPYLDLKDSVVKNLGSEREVPLHPHLVSLLNPEKKTGRIFNYNLNESGKAQQTASPALMKLIRKYTSDQLHVGHSLRGNFKDIMRDLGVSKETHDFITGHSAGDTAGNYGDGTSLKIRYEAILRIDANTLV